MKILAQITKPSYANTFSQNANAGGLRKDHLAQKGEKGVSVQKKGVSVHIRTFSPLPTPKFHRLPLFGIRRRSTAIFANNISVPFL